MAESPVELGSVVAGRYRIDRALGAGTMGVVVAAWHLELEQAVAIKFLNPSVLGASEALERFRREARAAARIKSEHVARVLDVGALENGLPFMVMELLEGRSLDEELMARGSIPVPEAVSAVLQVIDALAEAHAAGIVHRDLKPANLFVSQRADRSVVVKVLDFGISKIVGDTSGPSGVGLTRTGMIVGSPLYMSPEQLRSTKSVDQRADIWALGTILYQLVTGRTPYDADSAPDLYAMLLRDNPAPISRYRADLPPGLDAVIHHCLEREPEQRYANVSELADALVPFAPPDARVHADRARRVVMGPPTETSATTFEVAFEADSRAVPAAVVSAASTGGARPLIVTNRKTLVSSEDGEKRRSRLGVSLALLALLGAAAFVGLRWTTGRAGPMEPPKASVNASRADAKAALAADLAPSPPAAAAPNVAPTLPPDPPFAAEVSSAVPPAPLVSAVPSAPEVAPIAPPRSAAMPAAHYVAPPAKPAPVGARPAPAAAKPALPAAPPSAAQGSKVSDFGGRK